MFVLSRRVIVLILLFGRLCEPQNETGMSPRQRLFKHILQGNVSPVGIRGMLDILKY